MVGKVTCIYYVGEHQYKDWTTAIHFARLYRKNCIIEKRVDEKGNMTSKKHTLINGVVTGVEKL